MSNEAITWALRIKLPPGNALAKQVLFILANQANGDPGRGVPMLTHPSNAYVVETTGQDRKTVIENIKKLVAWGLITDTQNRVGRTKQVIVYEMHTGPDLLSQIDVEQSQKRNGSKFGTVSNNQAVAVVTVPRTVPQTGHGTNGTLKAYISDAGVRANDPDPPPADFSGSFEGHVDPPPPAPPTTDAGLISAELRRRGYRSTSLDPRLLSAVADGVTLPQVIEFAELYPADHPMCRGSPGYVISAAQRQATQPTEPSSTDPSGARHVPRRESDSDRRARRMRELDALESAGNATV